MRVRLDVEYVVPLRWSAEDSERESEDLGGYLTWLTRYVDVTVVDGSPDLVFQRHAVRWGNQIQHVRPAPWPGRNGKVAGVVTGVVMARHERVIIADDDVRYTLSAVRAVTDAVEGADLVRPQNHLVPHRWHTRWDTARSLISRAFDHDYPGTHALRRSTFVAMGGYDGDVLFENLQLSRTVEAYGGVVTDLPGLFVPRRPPTTRHFWSQRVRQAYDDFAQPPRLAAELSVLPLIVLVTVRRPRALILFGAVAVGSAERGRRRARGTRIYEPTAALWVIPWLLERAVCVWIASAERLRGGVRYGDSRMRAAASRPVLGEPLPVSGRIPTPPSEMNDARHR